MKKYLSYIICLLFLLLTGCSKDEEPVHYDKTVIVYMAAENSLSSNAYSDIKEMVSAAGDIPQNCRLVLYLDDSSSDTEPITKIIEITDGEARTVKELPELDSCDGENLTDIIKQICVMYPSDSYSLVLWSHGSSWLPGNSSTTAKRKSLGVDNLVNSNSDKGSNMEISELRQALAGTGIHFNWIMFDCCFMQSIEVAYELRSCTDYFIGSPAEIPVNGAPYDILVKYFFTTDQSAAPKAMATAYFNYYKSNGGLVMSVIKSSELEALASATKALLPEAPMVSVRTGITRYFPSCDYSNKIPEFFDMASLLYHQADATEYDSWKQQMERTVPVILYTSTWNSDYASYGILTDAEHCAGTSMYLPEERYEQYGYNSAIKDTQWWQTVWGI